MLSIVIPTHNEVRRLPATIKEINRWVKKPFEIIVVDDGSDSTARIARKMGCRVFHFNKCIGKGGALNYGIMKAKGEIIAVYDADASSPAKEINALEEKIRDFDLVIATRYSNKKKAKRPLARLVAAKTFKKLTHLLFNLNYTDTQCGLKLMKAKAGKTLAKISKSKGYVWDVELLLNASKKGFTVGEQPIEWREKTGGPLAKKMVRTTAIMLRDLLKLYLEQ